MCKRVVHSARALIIGRIGLDLIYRHALHQTIKRTRVRAVARHRQHGDCIGDAVRARKRRPQKNVRISKKTEPYRAGNSDFGKSVVTGLFPRIS
jgi:hypothetical protein